MWRKAITLSDIKTQGQSYKNRYGEISDASVKKHIKTYVPTDASVKKHIKTTYQTHCKNTGKTHKKKT